MRHQDPPSALPDSVSRARAITALAAIDVPTTPLRHGDGRGGDVLIERTIPMGLDDVAERAADAISRVARGFGPMETLRASDVAAQIPLIDAALAQLDVLASVVRPRIDEVRAMTVALFDDLQAAEAERAEAEAAERREAALDTQAEQIVEKREKERLQAIKDAALAEARAELATSGKGR